MWTSWYRKPLYRGIFTLAYMREMLDRHNLKSTYPDDANVGFAPSDLTPPDGATHFRTADGSWNNLGNPREGSAGTASPATSPTRRSGAPPTRTCCLPTPAS